MPNWNDVETNPCVECGTDDWRQFYENEYEEDPTIRDDSDVVEGRFACNGCDAEGRVFVEGGSVTYSGAMRV